MTTGGQIPNEKHYRSLLDTWYLTNFTFYVGSRMKNLGNIPLLRALIYMLSFKIDSTLLNWANFIINGGQEQLPKFNTRGWPSLTRSKIFSLVFPSVVSIDAFGATFPSCATWCHSLLVNLSNPIQKFFWSFIQGVRVTIRDLIGEKMCDSITKNLYTNKQTTIKVIVVDFFTHSMTPMFRHFCALKNVSLYKSSKTYN